jgi:hypothetical protein
MQTTNNTSETAQRFATGKKAVLSADPWFWLSFVILLGIHVYLIGSLHVYPFVDVPYHLAETTIYRHYDDADNHFKDYYSKKTGFQPNTFHLRFCGSSIFPDVETAYRFVFCLYVLLLPLSMLLVTTSLGASPWFSFLSFLMLYNFNVHWGFVGYMFSIPVFLIFFYLLLQHLKDGSLALSIVLSLLFILLFFIHALTTLFALLIFFLTCIFQYKNNFNTLFKKSLVALPGLVITGHWWFLQKSQGEQWTGNFVVEYYRDKYLGSLPQRAHLLWNDQNFLFRSEAGFWLELLITAFIISSLFPWLVAKFRSKPSTAGRKTVLPVYILFLSSFCCWFFLPGFVRSQVHIFDRFSVFFMLAIIPVAAAIAPPKLGVAFRMIFLAGAIVYTALWVDYFQDFKKDSASFTEDIFPSGGDKTLCGMIYDRRFRGFTVYQHFANYYMTWKKGIGCARFIDLKFSPAIKRKADFNKLPRYVETLRGKTEEDFRLYRNFDYVLVKAKSKTKALRFLKNFRLVRSSDTWFLYERRTGT